MYVEASQPFEAILESGETGLVGTLEVKIIDNDGATSTGPTAANITEDGTSGIYIWNAPAAPATPGQYTIVWSTDGSFDADSVAIDELVVQEAGATAPSPIPAPDDGGYSFGPCSAWTTAEDVFACCSADDVGSSPEMYDDAVDQASQILFELSGRQFAGLCSKTVRPCRTGCGCDWQVLSRGYVIWHGDYWNCNNTACGCSPLSSVLLSGYPVREITEVKIDGAVIAESEYRLDRKRYLIRKNGGQWPGCQDLSLDDTEEGTWSVSYTYGQNPPLAGRAAATELACEVYKSCAGDEECVLPDGVSRIQRQGIVIERNAFVAWGRQLGIWRTGLPLVDLFLNAYNPSGIRRRTTFITPGRRTYPLNT